MSNISKTTRLINEDGSINTNHRITEAEKLELMACALADIPAYNWFNRHSKPKEEILVGGNFMSYDEYMDDMYKAISKATNYLMGENDSKIYMNLPRCPQCRASVIYCDCGFTTEEDAKEILKGKVPAKFGLSKREAKMIGDMSYGNTQIKTIKK